MRKLYYLSFNLQRLGLALCLNRASQECSQVERHRVLPRVMLVRVQPFLLIGFDRLSLISVRFIKANLLARWSNG